MKSPTRSLLAAGIGLAISTSAFAQFHIQVNPTPIQNGFSHTVAIAVPNPGWIPGRNGNYVADGRLVIELKHRKTGSKHTLYKLFGMKKNAATTAFAVVVPSWYSREWKATSAKLQITLKSNGVNRTINLDIRS